MKFYQSKKTICILFSSFILLTGCNVQTVSPEYETSIENTQSIDDTVEYDAFSKQTDEEEIIEYFEKQEQYVDEMITKNDPTLKEKGKKIFVTFVDFIFYDGTIQGYTFQRLKEETKQEIIEKVNTIDSKIEEKYPNYKEEVVFKKEEASEKVQEGKEKVEQIVNEKIGEETVQNIIDTSKDIFEQDKENLEGVKEIILESDTTQKVIDTSKELFDSSKEAIQNGKTKIKSWYEDFSKN